MSGGLREETPQKAEAALPATSVSLLEGCSESKGLLILSLFGRSSTK